MRKVVFFDLKFGSIDSIDSTESTDSIDIIDSIDSILVPHKETANIHTTHKGRTKVPMGAAREARHPHRHFCWRIEGFLPDSRCG